jgi:hypothetical protein
MWSGNDIDIRGHLYLAFPWERERIDRALRLYIVAALTKHISLDKNAQRARYLYWMLFKGTGTLEQYYLPSPYIAYIGSEYGAVQCRRRLSKVLTAMDTWYREHDNTLPKSLDELVGTYLDELPVHPFTGAAVEYRVNAPPDYTEQGRNRLMNTYIYALGTDDSATQSRGSHPSYARLQSSGGTYIRLGGLTFVLTESAEEEQ